MGVASADPRWSRSVTPDRYRAAMTWIAVHLAALLATWGGVLALVSRRWTHVVGWLFVAAVLVGGGAALEAATRPAQRDAEAVFRRVVCPMLPSAALQRQCRHQIDTAPSPAVAVPHG